MPALSLLGEGIVYFALLSDGRTKIGATRNWTQRKKTHLTNGLCIVDEMILTVTQARATEKFYHNQFKNKRIEREFFKLEKSDYLDVAEECLNLILAFDHSKVTKRVVFPLLAKVGGCEKCGFYLPYERIGAQDGRCVLCGNLLIDVHSLVLKDRKIATSHPS